MASVIAPFEIFLDASGAPLSGGNLYIGTASLNPETNPITVYWDSAQTIPAAQPIKINGGYPSYAGSPGKLYVGTLYSITVKDKNGKLVFYSPISEAALGGAAVSTGAKNYVAAPDFESGTTAGWNLSKDSGTTVPISGGIGGGTTGFSALTIDNATPLAGTGSLVLNKNAGDVRGSTVYSNNITIDLEDTVRTLQLTFSYRTPTTNYTSGDLSVFIWDVNGSNLIPMSASSLDATVGGPANFFGTFIPSSNRVYRIIFQFTTTNANALLMNLDSVVLGPQVIPNAAAVGGWTSYTLTIGATTTAPTKGTNTTDLAQWMRVGQRMDWSYDYVQTAAGVAGSGTYLFPLPSGYSIDLTRFPANTIVGVANVSNIADESSAASDQGNLYVYDANNLTARYASPPSATDSLVIIGSSGFQLSNTVVRYRFKGSFAIAQWTTNINLATDFTEYASNDGTGTGSGVAVNTAYTPSSPYRGIDGSFIPAVTLGTTTATTNTTYVLTFSRPIQPSDKIELEYFISSQGWQNIGSNSKGYIESTYQGSTPIGMFINSIGTSTVTVAFSNAGRTSSGTYGTAGNNWSGISTTKWRVRKVSNGNMAETPPVVRADYYSADAAAVNVAINFSTKAEDTHSAVTTGAGVWKFTAPIAGMYSVKVNIQATSVNLYELRKGGATTTPIQSIIAYNSGAGTGQAVGTTDIRLLAGEYIDVRDITAANLVYATSRIQIVRIGS
jgi:hypothetical protein